MLLLSDKCKVDVEHLRQCDQLKERPQASLYVQFNDIWSPSSTSTWFPARGPALPPRCSMPHSDTEYLDGPLTGEVLDKVAVKTDALSASALYGSKSRFLLRKLISLQAYSFESEHDLLHLRCVHQCQNGGCRSDMAFVLQNLLPFNFSKLSAKRLLHLQSTGRYA